MSPLLEVTEDTPPDMLTGSMDLQLVLPDGNRVRMSVDRRTPMMDLLVQVTTAYKISPAGNVLQPYGESGILPYKPSTPIGALDTWIVHIVPKNQAIQNPSNKINLKQVIPPFEQTLRFQVNLPRNQLYVTRISGRCSMRDILKQACKEKNLDPSKYTLRHPKHLDKALCEEMSIAEYGHNQVTMLSLKNLPTAVSTEDILMMNKYKAQSDSGSGSAASSSVSPVPPLQPSKPTRKRRPAPKPPAPQLKQQNETIICHSRTSSDSSGYHEASVLSESPDSNNSSLPDSLPRRSKLPSVEPKGNPVESKLSRSLSNLHQASTSTASSSGLKPAQSTSCLVQAARKKKPAPPPPMVIAEEKEEKSATLPAGARLLNAPATVVTNAPLSHEVNHRVPSPIDDQDSESESARLEAEIERMFEQATREHVSLESGVELSRGPSPDWNWEYRLPAPPTFRDDVTAPSLNDLQLSGNVGSKQILFSTLESSEEVNKEESPTETICGIVNDNTTLTQNTSKEETNSIEKTNENIHITPVKNKITTNQSTNSTNFVKLNGHHDNVKLKDDSECPNIENKILSGCPDLLPNSHKDVIPNGHIDVIPNGHLDAIPNGHSEVLMNGHSDILLNGHSGHVIVNGHSESATDGGKKLDKIKKTEKVYITQEKVCNVNNYKEIVEIIPKTKMQSLETKNSPTKQNGSVKNQRNSQIIVGSIPKTSEIKAEKVCINIKSEEPHEVLKNVGKIRVERSDTVIRVNGRQERIQEQSAILHELATVISERQMKPKEIKLVEPERPKVVPLKNFSITTYSGSKPVEILKDKPIVKDTEKNPEIRKEMNGIIRSNSTAEEKKGPTHIKRSASVVTNLQRRLELSRSNGNLLEVDEFPLRNIRSNLRKTTSELSINIDPDEQKGMIAKQETGLQSLQVLRTILPQLSQSQGALNTVGEIDERKGEKPAVCLTTWGERPKRQVSIKTDRDYVTNGAKLESQTSVTVEVVSPTKPSPTLIPADRTVGAERRPRTSVYRTIETGNTKAIRLPPSDLGRIPIVRAVELKKQPDSRPPEESSILNSIPDKPMVADKPFAFEKPSSFSLSKSNRVDSRQIRPPSYLFGCEPQVPPPPPAPLAPHAVKLKPVSQRGEVKKPVTTDPRDELLASIRNFGKSSLRKVSTR